MSDDTKRNRLIYFDKDVAGIPEKLLSSHYQGEVLFLAGAGISIDSGLQSFRELVIQVYELVDQQVHNVITNLPKVDCIEESKLDLDDLNDSQIAEVRRFLTDDYDVVLGMLDRRMDPRRIGGSTTKVREAIRRLIDRKDVLPNQNHNALIHLSDRGLGHSIATTNFDLLFERCSANRRSRLKSISLGAIPRPSLRESFSGIFHLHGVVKEGKNTHTDLVLTDLEFGEHYLKRRSIPDFIYDASRIFNIVLVGYSANDPPMKYLLSSLAADGERFRDMKDRFVFVDSDSLVHVNKEEWAARGVFPVVYQTYGADHSELTRTLEAWARFSAHSNKDLYVEARIKSITSVPRPQAQQADQDLFDHLVARARHHERMLIVSLLADLKVDYSWLDAVRTIHRTGH